jgi:hypothetical protein
MESVSRSEVQGRVDFNHPEDLQPYFEAKRCSTVETQIYNHLYWVYCSVT